MKKGGTRENILFELGMGGVCHEYGNEWADLMPSPQHMVHGYPVCEWDIDFKILLLRGGFVFCVVKNNQEIVFIWEREWSIKMPLVTISKYLAAPHV
jgi:hypothetical protein